MSCHITNLSVNKRFPGHPGQIPCDLPVEYPDIFPSIAEMWREIALACTEFMKEQSNPNNFEFYGFDVILDQNRQCWLIEINRLPGLESSDNNKAGEDAFYNEMMLSVLRIVTIPLTAPGSSVEDKISDGSISDQLGRWRIVGGKSTECRFGPSAQTWKNLFRWKIFTTKNKNKLIV